MHGYRKKTSAKPASFFYGKNKSKTIVYDTSNKRPDAYMARDNKKTAFVPDKRCSHSVNRIGFEPMTVSLEG